MSAGASKIVSLADLAGLVPDGSSLALGGSFLHRGPFAFVRELIRQGRRDLEVVKQSPGYDIDLLCRAGALSRAKAGIVAMEGNFGLAPWYRKAIETGQVRLEEHACASLTAGLRAAAFGVPFMPCGGIHGSDLAALNGWKTIEDPYGSGEAVYAIPRIAPDFAVIQALTWADWRAMYGDAGTRSTLTEHGYNFHVGVALRGRASLDFRGFETGVRALYGTYGSIDRWDRFQSDVTRNVHDTEKIGDRRDEIPWR